MVNYGFMPLRKTPIVPGEIYHVFNRSIAKQPIFINQKDYQRAINVLNYYIYERPRLRFSHFNRLSTEEKYKFLGELKSNPKILEIFAYCIMPNHVHFLLKGIKENSIQIFMGNFQHSYSKYFNIKYKRSGSLFQSRFKAVRIETDEQLIHVSRYIHLNPTSSFLIKPELLSEYNWSSFKDYMNGKVDGVVQTTMILKLIGDREKYKNFVFDQMGYQRELEIIKHMVFDDPGLST